MAWSKEEALKYTPYGTYKGWPRHHPMCMVIMSIEEFPDECGCDIGNKYKRVRLGGQVFRDRTDNGK